MYEEQWGDAEVTAPPEVPGQVEEDEEEPKARYAKEESAEVEEVEAVKA